MEPRFSTRRVTPGTSERGTTHEPASDRRPGRPPRVTTEMGAPNLEAVLARLRVARFGEMRQLAAEFGLSVNRLQYLRYKILGMKFSQDDRQRWLHAQRKLQKAPANRHLVPKRVGLTRQDHIGDWTVQEQQALLRLREEEAEERRTRPELIARAKEGSITALLHLKQRYRLRLPLVEDELPEETRRLLPWLAKGNGHE